MLSSMPSQQSRGHTCFPAASRDRLRLHPQYLAGNKFPAERFLDKAPRDGVYARHPEMPTKQALSHPLRVLGTRYPAFLCVDILRYREQAPN